MIQRVALIGFGEVGQRLARDFHAAGVRDLRAWDTAFADPTSRPSLALQGYAVHDARSAAEAVAGAELVVSAVTAAQTVDAARSVLNAIPPGAYFLDLNSASPAAKTEAATMLAWTEGRYVEAAVMSPIEPRGVASPMLLGGPNAGAFLEMASGLGFAGAKLYSDRIGAAAATKLCRSVMIKGIEALLTESMLAARHYGVEKAVLDSLSDLLPVPDWERTAQYMISRSLQHGARRAEEMLEAARTVEEAGVAGLMSRATAERQQRAAAFGSFVSDDLAEMLDAMNRILEVRG